MDLASFLRSLDLVTDDFNSNINTPVSQGSMRICQHYSRQQLKLGRLRSASAWFDLSNILNPVNANIENPQEILARWKFCDACDTRDPIRGLWHWCTLCREEFSDLCHSCFENRSSTGHVHDSYWVSPASPAPLPSIEEHMALLVAH
jgi:hypothetical protein